MINFLKKHEPFFFVFIVLIYCAPILIPFHFITLDGPAHLYNSKIIYQLLFNNISAVSAIFSFNNFPIPNYFYHALGALLFAFFDEILVEKTIATLYVFLLCYGYRKLVLANNTPVYVSYLIFPFVYAFSFSIGFYNFSFAIAFLMWFVFLLKKQENFKILKFSALISLLYITLYFSHLMVFLLAICIAIGFFILKIIKTKHVEIKNTLAVFLPSIPFIIFSFLFVSTHNSTKNLEYIPFNELKNWVIDARHFIGLDYDSEYKFTRFLTILFFILLILNLSNTIKSRVKVFFFSEQNLFFCIAVSFLIFLFILPNNLVSGGYLSVRLLLFSNLFLIIYFAFSKQTETKAQRSIVFLVFICSLILGVKKTITSYQLGKDFKEYTQINNYIKEQSVVLPIDYSKNWINSNYGCYLGSSKNVVVLDNYEASTVHFPLIWKNKKYIPGNYMPDYGTNYNPKLDIINYELKSNIKINYVVRWKYAEADKNNNNNTYTDSILKKHFVKIFVSSGKKAELFKHKN